MLAVMDIGGTQCRLARFREDGSGPALEAVALRATEDMTDTDSLLRAWETALDTPLSSVRALIIGVAGPVDPEGTARLSNAALAVSQRAAAERFGVRRCRVVNDFITEAYACLTPVGSRAVRLFGPPAPDPGGVTGPESGPVAVLGAGTGLGTAWLVPGWDATGRTCLRALPSEFGHAPFPFEGREELDFAAFAREALHRRVLSADDVVTGRGVALLHAFLSGERLSEAEAAAKLCGHEEGLRWYARLLGRVCGQWALATLCRGGLFLTGGMVLRNPAVTAHPAFREAFLLAPELQVLEHVPVARFDTPYSGLWGGAALAAREAAGDGENTPPE